MFRHGDPGGRMYTSVGTNNVNLLAHWTNEIINGVGFAVSAGNGRSTGSCLRQTSTNAAHQSALSKTLDAQATWGIAFAFRVSLLPSSSNQTIIQFTDSGTVQCDLRLSVDGTLFVTRNGTVLGGTATAYVTPNSWVHIELKILINASTGTVGLWINGFQRLNLTAQNTRNTANSSANGITIGQINTNSFGNSVVNLDFDDIIVYDGQATDANGFTDITGPIGDCGLTWLLPTGAGTTTQFTPDSGSNWARVSEATPDGDTSYVEDATVGHIDTYATADLGATVATVKSLALVHFAKKTDLGSRGMKAEVRSAGASAAHATEQALSTSYVYYFSNFGQDPNNGSATNWTPTSVNALEIGQTVSS